VLARGAWDRAHDSKMDRVVAIKTLTIEGCGR